MNNVWVRFENGQQAKISKEFGPFEFVQLTYELLRVSPYSDELAGYVHGFWYVMDGSYPHQPYSDVVIFAKSEEPLSGYMELVDKLTIQVEANLFERALADRRAWYERVTAEYLP